MPTCPRVPACALTAMDASPCSPGLLPPPLLAPLPSTLPLPLYKQQQLFSCCSPPNRHGTATPWLLSWPCLSLHLYSSSPPESRPTQRTRSWRRAMPRLLWSLLFRLLLHLASSRTPKSAATRARSGASCTRGRTCALEPASPAAASASACRRGPMATRSCAASATPTGRRTGTGPSAPERRLRRHRLLQLSPFFPRPRS